MARKQVLFHQENAPAHTSAIAMAKIHELGFELIPHPPYSSNFASCDSFLLPNLKTWFGGNRFSPNEEVIDAVNAYFTDLDESYVSEGMTKLESRWTKCSGKSFRLKVVDYAEK